MDEKRSPKNHEGQPPTRGGNETIERLEEKKEREVGAANRERIEDQEREVSSER